MLEMRRARCGAALRRREALSQAIPALVAFAEAMYYMRRGPMFRRGFGRAREKTTAGSTFLGSSHGMTRHLAVGCSTMRASEGHRGRRSSSRISEKEEEALFATLPAVDPALAPRAAIVVDHGAFGAFGWVGRDVGLAPGEAGGDVTTTTARRARDRAVLEPRDRDSRGAPEFGGRVRVRVRVHRCRRWERLSRPRTCSRAAPVARRGRARPRARRRAACVPPAAQKEWARPARSGARFPPVRGTSLEARRAFAARAPPTEEQTFFQWMRGLGVDAPVTPWDPVSAGSGAAVPWFVFSFHDAGVSSYRFFRVSRVFARKNAYVGATSRRLDQTRGARPPGPGFSPRKGTMRRCHLHARARDGRATARVHPRVPFARRRQPHAPGPRPKRRSFAGRALAWRAALVAATTTTRSRRTPRSNHVPSRCSRRARSWRLRSGATSSPRRRSSRRRRRGGARPRVRWAKRANLKRYLTAEEEVRINLFQKNTPSVVYITNVAQRMDAFTLSIQDAPAGAGSGTAPAAGKDVTNWHVVAGAAKVNVTLTDQQVFSATVVGYDDDKDIAVLQVDYENPVAVAMGKYGTPANARCPDHDEAHGADARPLPIE